MSQEFIKTIRDNFTEEFQFDAKIRVIVLILEDSHTNETLCGQFRNAEIPVILALKVSVGEELVSTAHLCVAADNVLIGKRTAGEALKLGLINKIAAPEKVETEASKLAETIAGLAPIAVRACLKAVTNGLEMPLADGLKLEAELFTQMFSTEDMREGTRAFLEKRKPVFRNK